MLQYVGHHREPSEVELVETLSGGLYWWVELGVPSLHRECVLPHSLIHMSVSDMHVCVSVRGSIKQETLE